MFFWNGLVLVITLGLLLPACWANGQDICPEPPSSNNNDEPACISVVTWNGLVQVLEGASSGMLVLCPFDITKGESDAPVNLNTTARDRLHIVCQQSNQGCVLRGKGGHMVIHGANTRITLQQITFMGASNTAISISSTAPRRQIFCDCHFIQNRKGNSALKGPLRINRERGDQFSLSGGAIAADIGSGQIFIMSCLFEKNSAEYGGAISNVAQKMYIHNSIFRDNFASYTGSSIKSDELSSLYLSRSSFNDVRGYRGFEIDVSGESGAWVDEGRNKAAESSTCGGIYNSTGKVCHEFRRLETGYACESNKQCLSGVCKNGACYGSDECMALQHQPGTEFDKNRVNIVFVGSGFVEGGTTSWQNEAQFTFSRFQIHEAFAKSNPLVNVFYVDNYEPSFCWLNCQNIGRLLCCDIEKAATLADKCVPKGASRQTVVVHNDLTYGGAGYSSADMATSTIHPSGPEIIIHELGHSLFELGDEYDYRPSTNVEPNCDIAGCPKWKDLIGVESVESKYGPVSCSQKACSGGNYFVGSTSLMEFLFMSFGAVNTRFTCCAFLAMTNEMPPYCDLFDFSKGYLYQYCANNDFQKFGAYSTTAAPYDTAAETDSFRNSLLVPMPMTLPKLVQIENPLLVTISLETNLQREVKEKSVIMQPNRAPGLFRWNMAHGDFASKDEAVSKGLPYVVKVIVKFQSRPKQVLWFADDVPVHIPPPPFEDKGDSSPESINEKSSSIEIALEVPDFSDIKSIQARVVSF